ncbi:MAG: response regulator, partial [Desulfobacterales bacterium]
SEPGKGTTFHVFLPRIEEEAVAQDTGNLTESPTGKERILLVDDEEAIVDLGQRILKRLGYEVTTRTCSVEALETFKAEPDFFDLVITDQTMPKMTGVELAKAFMRIRPGIPMILCSGYSETISREDAKALGIREYMMKPFSMAAMAETIRKVLEI